jgi:hypothetical protein
MLVSLTVGKVDAGVAVLLTEDKRLVRQADDYLHLLLVESKSLPKRSTLLRSASSLVVPH